MMKKLIVGIAAGLFLAAMSAEAKGPAKGAAKRGGGAAGKIEDCDEKSKASAEGIQKAIDDLKASGQSGKAGGHFGKAQKALSNALAEVKKGCTYTAKHAAKGDAKQGAAEQKADSAEQKAEDKKE